MNDVPPIPPEPGSVPPPSPPRGGPNWWLWGCVGVPLALLVLALVALSWGWRAFVSYGMASDFTKYEQDLRQSNLTPEEQRPRIEKMERLRDRARSAPIGFWRWLDYDASLKSILEDQKVTPEELEALDRELDRMEKEFR